jgi:hypothetical protein
MEHPCKNFAQFNKNWVAVSTIMIVIKRTRFMHYNDTKSLG